MFFYKVTAFGLDCFFWLHQCLNTTSYVGILLLLAGAPKDRDGGICESPLPYPLDSNSSTPGDPLRRGIIAAAGLLHILSAEFRCGSLIPSSEFGAAVCVRAGIARVSDGLVRLVSHVIHYWWIGR